ncbi:signal transduction histidine kinase [Clostridium pascui]|uniref:ATP-binding protein n=1 Tax=Clostridium pascui TaxID=46609 RepID=UPI0019572B16|nr:ATP-binding protein [Clostridium pascui]MBM7868580.1 signal transduction histidine kinase [Clostridium pascui]
MFKTLKFKMSMVYLILVSTTAIVGGISFLNIYTLNKSINGLMVNNYRSISATANMLEILNDQNSEIYNYIYVNPTSSIDNIHNNINIFYQWYNLESSNITEDSEKELVAKINNNYSTYLRLFSQIQEVKNFQGIEAASKYYTNNLLPVFNSLKKDLKELSFINEKAMFKNKEVVTKDAHKSLDTIIFLSVVSVLGGFILSRYSIKRTLKPIYSLRETMKAIKEGNLSQQAPIISEDEIGELTIEFNNMTDRIHKLEESNIGKLLIEKTKSDAIIKSISDPLIVLDSNYKIIRINMACEKFFNIEETSSINKYFLEVIRSGELFDFIYNSSKLDIMNPSLKIIYFNINEEDYYFNIIVTIVRDTEAKINGIIILLQNVTNLKQLEQIKSDFISTISHEFKTPLTSIMIGASLILDASIGSLNESQHQIINTIQEDGEKLNTLVNNLLQLSKLECSDSIFNIMPCSITNLVNNAISDFCEQAFSAKINLHYEAKENLPYINADPEKTSWVLNNLISNALKYTQAGGEIIINTFTNQNSMYVSVSDTGSGIPKEYHEEIFNRFVQVRGENSDVKGTGLGLAIAKEIVKAHGGEIWCESKLGYGSVFTFTLPLAVEKI